jgi:hypothetical protein
MLVKLFSLFLLFTLRISIKVKIKFKYLLKVGGYSTTPGIFVYPDGSRVSETYMRFSKII